MGRRAAGAPGHRSREMIKQILKKIALRARDVASGLKGRLPAGDAPEKDLRRFCAAPWVEGVLYPHGHLYTCCRNGTSLGNWQEKGLAKAWRSREFRRFRKTVLQGVFPDDACRNCYFNGTARSLASELHAPFHTSLKALAGLPALDHQALAQIESLFSMQSWDGDARKAYKRAMGAYRFMRKRFRFIPPDARLALEKISIIGRIAKAYLKGDCSPPVVAPFRQVRLISRCNARCIQCPGKYTGDITEGPSIDDRHIDTAFSNTIDIIDFFMNGSEFLLYPGWKKVASMLNDNGVKLSISSNGILLTQSTMQYLIDNRIIHKLNVSMDGATKETLESIRVNVDFGRLKESLKFIFSHASERAFDFDLSLSFVLMRRNYREFPRLVRLVAELKGAHPMPRPYIFCQSLENYGFEGYKEFVRSEHHSLIDREELSAVFDETLRASQETGIPCGAFYSYTLEDFIRKGYPFPPLPE